MKISKSKKTDNALVAQLHMQVFPGFFLSTLGYRFLKKYYSVVLKHPETICLLARNERDDIMGYVLGRACAAGYLKKIVKSAPLTFMWEGVKLLFSHPKALVRLVKNLDKKSDKKEIKDSQEYAEIGLIGVMPEFKGKGIGHQLLDAFEKELKKRKVESLSLTTDYDDNKQTLIAYKAWGFEVLYEFVTYPNRRMYRLIKKVK